MSSWSQNAIKRIRFCFVRSQKGQLFLNVWLRRRKWSYIRRIPCVYGDKAEGRYLCLVSWPYIRRTEKTWQKVLSWRESESRNIDSAKPNFWNASLMVWQVAVLKYTNREQQIQAPSETCFWGKIQAFSTNKTTEVVLNTLKQTVDTDCKIRRTE
jgi:hypothetical protein